jgi:hypothetical protein
MGGGGHLLRAEDEMCQRGGVPWDERGSGSYEENCAHPP